MTDEENLEFILTTVRQFLSTLTRIADALEKGNEIAEENLREVQKISVDNRSLGS